MFPEKNNHVLLLLGSNLGDRMEMLDNAMKRIVSFGDILSVSSVYETEPWGFATEGKFYNLAVEIVTSYSPRDILGEIKHIEEQQGRTRTSGNYQSRKIDIDIMFYNSEIISDDHLTIPHPLMQERRFALVPLAEIAGDWYHPVLNKRISEILKECKDSSEVARITMYRK